ncbi:stage II sporulation protein E [Paenibacillus sp. UMB4589-SE434]|uniref:stage II sporulation protein E n=1 Tax=Paenibacillus sp. UMB4589-SE434 TaxID=3046314 RepID=UPI00254BD386|nr:stage II sporulation protein E [Paenibacillus sp. UMB4589-SE434]MDK8184113.1 stage II sporulation protein E [Paenibacillus sp. UMB4589-SE434]
MSKTKIIPFPKQYGQEPYNEEAVAMESGAKKWRYERFKQLIGTRKWTIFILCIGFLLGRAVILEDLFPFASAFFAVMYFTRRDLAVWTGTSLLAGSLFAAEPTTLMIGIQLLLIVLMQRGLQAYERSEMNYAPFMVLAANFMVHFFMTMMTSQLTWYPVMMDITDAVLGFMLTLVFVQALPVLTLNKRNYTLRTEELICLMILLASMMVGAVGWMVQGLQFDHVLSRFLVMIFAFVGGAPLGASVGVILGLILSLAEPGSMMQMSLLAFAGLMAGLMREGKRWAVSFGMLLGTAILSVYLGPANNVLASTWETIAAAVLFMLVPRSIMDTLAKYIPGTQEHLNSQQEYAKRVRDMTADRVKQFSELFRQLSRSFGQMAGTGEIKQKEEEFNSFIEAVSQKTCAVCPRQQACWNNRYLQTVTWMTDMMTAIEEKPEMKDRDILPRWKDACLKTPQVLAQMKYLYEKYRHDQDWRKQVYDSRTFVSEQLSGVSQVMDDLAKEIQREGREMFMQEEQIRQAMEELGLSVNRVDILSLDKGHVEIEMVHSFTDGYDECRKLIAPLLSDILGELISVREEQHTDRSGRGVVTFVSAKSFEVQIGMAGAAKGGDMLSGDSYHALELSGGKYAIALSDGMGNGERARMESSTALTVLSQFLQSGMDEKLAIQSVNQILMVRSSDEVYATVDLAIVDLYTAKTTLMKSGSIPSFIKSGKDVQPLSAGNLPLGILQDIDVDAIHMHMKPGDLLIMMTDGVYDAPGPAINKDLWLRRLISELETDDPQEIADILLDTVIHYSQGQIYDDMSVVVTRLDRHMPQWATLHWNQHDRMERPLTVS